MLVPGSSRLARGDSSISLALCRVGRRPQDQKPRRPGNTGRKTNSHPSSVGPYRLTYAEQPERAVVSLRLCLPQQAWHSSRLHGSLCSAHHPGWLCKCVRSSSCNCLPMRLDPEGNNQTLLAEENEGGRKDAHHAAS
jgi:hypothetical protein